MRSLVVLFFLSYSYQANAQSSTLGWPLQQRDHLDGGVVIIPNPKKEFASAATIDKWRAYVRNGGRFYLQVWRPIDVSSFPHKYKLIVSTEFSEVTVIPTSNIREVACASSCDVLAGDTLGLFFPGVPAVNYFFNDELSITCNDNKASMIHVVDYLSTQLPVGEELLFSPLDELRAGKTNDYECRGYTIKAFIQ